MPITAQELVRREVYYCVSMLLSELTRRADSFSPEDAEALYDLAVAKRDYGESCREAGWQEVTDPTWFVFSSTDTCVVIKEGCEAGWQEVTDPTWLVFSSIDTCAVIKEGREAEAWAQLFASSVEEAYDPEAYLEEATVQEICEGEGWELSDSPTFYNPETGETSEADGWEELACEFGIEPYEWEAFEHWLVSDWLGDRLMERGYTVREVFGLTVWARGTTGQAIYIDGVIEDIVDELNSR